MTRWYESPKCEESAVIAGQISFVRNIDGYPFEDKMTDAQRAELLMKVKEAVGQIAQILQIKFIFYRLQELTENEVGALVGRLTIPPLMMGDHAYAGLLVSEDEDISILVNGKEHICVQISCPGHAIREAYVLMNRVDDLLNSKLPYAFSVKYGYLTASPLLTGTGMTASYLLHLPFLDTEKKISGFEKELSQYGFILGGHFHGKSQAPGHIYRVRNRKTLGLSEPEIISALEHLAHQIRQQEEQLAAKRMLETPDAQRDVAYRTYGLLRFAWELNYDEAMTCLSLLRASRLCGCLPEDILPSAFAAMTEMDDNVLKIKSAADNEENAIQRQRAMCIHRCLGSMAPPDLQKQ